MAYIEKNETDKKTLVILVRALARKFVERSRLRNWRHGEKTD